MLAAVSAELFAGEAHDAGTSVYDQSLGGEVGEVADVEVSVVVHQLRGVAEHVG